MNEYLEAQKQVQNEIQALSQLYEELIISKEDIIYTKELLKESLNKKDDQKSDFYIDKIKEIREKIFDYDFHIDKLKQKLNII